MLVFRLSYSWLIWAILVSTGLACLYFAIAYATNRPWGAQPLFTYGHLTERGWTWRKNVAILNDSRIYFDDNYGLITIVTGRNAAQLTSTSVSACLTYSDGYSLCLPVRDVRNHVFVVTQAREVAVFLANRPLTGCAKSMPNPREGQHAFAAWVANFVVDRSRFLDMIRSIEKEYHQK